MDPRLKTIAENLDSWKLGLDNSFQFHCTACGKCCIDREDILLTPRDLYNASKALNLAPTEFVNTYCECYIGQDSRIPIVRLKPRGSIKRCPLLKDHKCSIHSAKPAVCALYPLGRAMSFEKGSYNHDGVVGGEIQYFISPFNCGDKSETHTVREWLTDFNLPVEDRYFLSWHAFISEVCLFIRKIEGKVSDKLLDTIWTTIYQLIYLCYDTGEDFMTQFERNKSALLEIIQESKKELGDVT